MADLPNIIGMADFINHAILTYNELNGALARLSAARYIYKRGNNYHPSRKVLNAYAGTTTSRRPVSNELDDMAEFLNVSPLEAGNSAPSPRGNALRQSEYRDAGLSYQNQASKKRKE